MSAVLEHFNGVAVLRCAPDGPLLRGERDAVDLLGEAFSLRAEWVLLPVGRLHADFFRLRTGVAGEIVQKFVTYRVGLVILGDISDHLAASSALRDFVRECDRGTQTWFASDDSELLARFPG